MKQYKLGPFQFKRFTLGKLREQLAIAAPGLQAYDISPEQAIELSAFLLGQESVEEMFQEYLKETLRIAKESGSSIVEAQVLNDYNMAAITAVHVFAPCEACTVKASEVDRRAQVWRVYELQKTLNEQIISAAKGEQDIEPLIRQSAEQILTGLAAVDALCEDCQARLRNEITRQFFRIRTAMFKPEELLP